MIEKLIKLSRRAAGQPHTELRGRKAVKGAFWAGMIAKGAVFTLTLATLFSRSLSMSR